MTAVEFLIENLGEYFPHEIGGINYLVEQAKQLEEQQKREEYLRGYKEGINSGSAYYPD